MNIKTNIAVFAAGCVTTLLISNAQAVLDPLFIGATALLVAAAAWSWHLLRKRDKQD